MLAPININGTLLPALGGVGAAVWAEETPRVAAVGARLGTGAGTDAGAGGADPVEAAAGVAMALFGAQNSFPASKSKMAVERTVRNLWIAMAATVVVAVVGFFAVGFAPDSTEAAVWATNFGSLGTWYIGVLVLGVGIVLKQLDDSHAAEKILSTERTQRRQELEALGTRLDDALQRLLVEVDVVCDPAFAWCSFDLVFRTNWMTAASYHEAILLLVSADFRRFKHAVSAEPELRFALKTVFPSVFHALEAQEAFKRTDAAWLDLSRVVADEAKIWKRVENFSNHEKVFSSCNGLAEAIENGLFWSHASNSPQYYVYAQALRTYAAQMGWLGPSMNFDDPATAALMKLLRVTNLPA